MTIISLVSTLNQGTKEPDLAHPDVTRGYQEWLSRHDWYKHWHACACSLEQSRGVWRSTLNMVWTGGLSDVIPKCVWLKCKTSKVTEV